MKTEGAQWILWAVTMIIFVVLTLSSHFDWLIIAMVVASLVWYTVVPRATSR